MATEGERLARLEEQVGGLREDVGSLVTEQQRTRTRLHNLEGVAQAFMEVQRVNRQREEDQYRKLGVRIQLVGLLLAAAAVLSPLVTVLLARK